MNLNRSSIPKNIKSMMNSQKIKKIILTILGILSLSLGIIGIVLPVLPTTPFLLLASFLFIKSSKKLNDWLLENKILGPYIYNYRKYNAIKRRTKITAIILLWISLMISFYLVDIIYVRVFLILVGIAVSIHLLNMNTLENIDTQKNKSL